MTDAVAPIDVADAAAPPATEPITGFKHRYILLMLLGAYTLSFLDRQVVTILAEPIKIDLRLSDTQVGMLTGLAFAIFYTFLGIPIARLADRFSRPMIIAVSMTLWSAFTLLSGRAQNFTVIGLARLGVGFGEAGCNPCAHSMIADITPPQTRASALAFYSLGVPIGTILGLVLGGVIADAYGWRAAFLVAGAPGLLLALVTALTIKEPRAKPPAQPLGEMFAEMSAGFLETFAALRGKRTFWLMAGATGLLAFVGYGHGPFAIAYFLRVHGDEVTALGHTIGLGPKGFLGIAGALSTGVGALAGTFLGGRLADRAAARDKRAYMSVPAIGALLSLPFYWFIYTVQSPLLALSLGLLPALLNTLWYGPVYATAQSVVPPQYRATTAAILLFVLNMIGLGFGPMSVGALSDFLAGPMGLGVAEGVRWALIFSSGAVGIAVVLFWLARKTVREDIVS
jgi:MFS family permease